MTWLNNVIGGISTPRIYRLEDNNRITNGSIEDALGSEWFGDGYTRVLASDNSVVAPLGDYILRVEDDAVGSYEAGKQSVDYGAAVGGKSFLLTVKCRASGSDHSITIKLGSSTTANGAINNATSLTVPLTTDYWRIVHLVVTFGGGVTDQYVQINLGGSTDVVTTTGIAFFDDVRVYEILETYNFEQPQRWEQPWTEEKVADFRLLGGKMRSVSEGWRYKLNMVYTYHSATSQQDVIEITESGLLYVVPHIDNLFGSLMQWNGDYQNEYFFGRYLGHSTIVSLSAVELEKEKPREIGTDYTVA